MSTKCIKHLICALGFAFLLSACNEEAARRDPDRVSYHASIRALVETRCASCHERGGIAPFPLESFEDVTAHAAGMVAAVESRSMPPWHYDPACHPVDSAGLTLSEAERALFSRWRESGYSEGDPKDYIAPNELAGSVLPEPDLVLAPESAYTPDDKANDDYRCLPLPLEFATDTLVYATHVRPGQTDFVHHVIIYVVPSSARAELDALDAADAAPGFSCFGDAGVKEAEMLAGWAPGGGVDVLAGDDALRIAKGSRLVMQVHYNTGHGHRAENIPADRSELELWTLPKGELPKNLITFLPVEDLNIDIAPGDASSKHVSERTLLVDADIVGVAPHMHLLGETLTTELVRADGSKECLTHVPRWDFHWQRGYSYEKGSELRLQPGDRVRLTCIYNNSAEHQPEGSSEPRRVRWGEGTFDEMCLDYLTLRVPYHPAVEGSVCGGYRGCTERCQRNDSLCHVECMTAYGIACLTCGINGLTGPCAEQACLSQLVSFGGCYDRCPTKDTDDYGGCLSDCRLELDALFSCMLPVLEAGQCDEELTACPDIAH